MGEHSLTTALRALLWSRRTAALGTRDERGDPFVSMVPYAIDSASQEAILHVSALAAHTGNMRRWPHVSLLVCAPDVDGEPVHALPRVTLDALARTAEPGSEEAISARHAYLTRFPEADDRSGRLPLRSTAGARCAPGGGLRRRPQPAARRGPSRTGTLAGMSAAGPFPRRSAPQCAAQRAIP